MSSNRQKGFTLIELVIVVAVMAILAIVALTNYSRYGFRSRRSDGKQLMELVAAAEERYYTNYNKYTVSLTTLGFATDPAISKYQYYSVAVANGTTGDTQSYQITGTPQGGQASDVCGALGLSNANVQTPLAGVMPQNSNGSCW